MFQKLSSYILIIMGLSCCVHGEDRQSKWAELDGNLNMECNQLRPFEEAKSIRLKSVRFFILDKKIFILVTHVMRSGAIESKIGLFSDRDNAPNWLYTSNGPSLGFISETEFVEAETSGVNLILNGKKSPLINKPFEIIPEILSISRSRFAVLDGREVTIFSRDIKGMFSEEKKLNNIRSWTSDLNAATFMVPDQDGLIAYLVTDRGIASQRVSSVDFGMIQDGDGTLTYKISTGEFVDAPGVTVRGSTKSWKYGYLRAVSTDSNIFIQRWVDGESVVEMIVQPSNQMTTLGVLPPNWWIRSIANQSAANPEIIVEGDHEWYLCSKGD